MPSHTYTCEGCICHDRGLCPEILELCRELRAQCLCQKQVALQLAGQFIVEVGEHSNAAAIRARASCNLGEENA